MNKISKVNGSELETKLESCIEKYSGGGPLYADLISVLQDFKSYVKTSNARDKVYIDVMTDKTPFLYKLFGYRPVDVTNLKDVKSKTEINNAKKIKVLIKDEISKITDLIQDQIRCGNKTVKHTGELRKETVQYFEAIGYKVELVQSNYTVISYYQISWD